MDTTSTRNYRVIETTKIGFGNDANTSENIVWQGADPNALSIQYPPSPIFGADRLSHREIEDGFIRTDFRFEQQTEDGSWEECADPRRRLTPTMTRLEREIDAENRRDFPGDYI